MDDDTPAGVPRRKYAAYLHTMFKGKKPKVGPPPENYTQLKLWFKAIAPGIDIIEKKEFKDLDQ